MFCKRGVLRKFAKFTGKHLCQRLFFNKVAVQGLRPASLLKKSLWHRCFPVDFAKLLRTTFFTEHLRWLLKTKAITLKYGQTYFRSTYTGLLCKERSCKIIVKVLFNIFLRAVHAFL